VGALDLVAIAPVSVLVDPRRLVEGGKVHPNLSLALLLVVGSLMVSIFAFRNELDNGDRNCCDNNHVNVTALMLNKLQEQPEHHQNCKSNPHSITCPTDFKSGPCGSRPARSATWLRNWKGALG